MSSRRERFVDTNFSTFNRPHQQPNPFSIKKPPKDFTEVQRLLQEELSTNTLYNEVWQQAQIKLNRKRASLSSKNFSASTPNECYVAVMAYTMNTELYKDFNNRFRALKNEDSWNKFPYKSFYYLLVLVYPGIEHNPNPNQTLYRGIEGIHFAYPKVGDEFYFDYFASSSSDRHVAEELFLGDNGTLVVVKGGARVAMGITNYSQFDDEEEVLIMPCNKFKVVKYARNGPIDVLEIETKEENTTLITLFMRSLSALSIRKAFIKKW